MIKSEIITAKIKNRILVTDAPIFSGETVKIKLDFDCGDAVAANHKIVLFGVDKTALAEGTFTATENAWSADLNTATNEMAAYFADVPIDATKSIGAMVVNTQTADVITRGNVLVVSTPFPSELTPAPTPFDFVSESELEEVSSSLSAEFESGLSSLSSDVANKADASTVAELSSTVAALDSHLTDYNNPHRVTKGQVISAASILSADIANGAITSEKIGLVDKETDAVYTIEIRNGSLNLKQIKGPRLETIFRFADASEETYLFEGALGQDELMANGFLVPDGFYDWLKFPTSASIGYGVTTLDDNLFTDCTRLESVKIPNSVTKIKTGVFMLCRNLTLVNIPDSVTSIGYAAFLNCESLMSLTIPASVTSIDTDAFADCALEELTFEGKTKAQVQGMAKYPWGISRTEFDTPCIFTSTADGETWTIPDDPFE